MTLTPAVAAAGNPQAPPRFAAASHLLTRRLFLTGLGVVYLIAFMSLGAQVDGLIGSRGVIPAHDFLAAVRDGLGISAYWRVPTLCWFNDTDAFLGFLCGGGTALSVLLIAGVAPIPVLVLLWVFYLSLVSAGSTFMGFQWDALLLETGLLAVFLAPAPLLPGLARQSPPSPAAVWLLRWLLFRFMFLSGMVKLTSGDPAWRDLTALDYHFFTQPLPAWTAWYANQLPDWFQALAVIVMFVIEIAVPFLIFGPRRARILAFFPLVGLQALIALTGNFGFFNLLTVVLCTLLLDDPFLRRFLPATIAARIDAPRPPPWRGRRWVLAAAWALIFPLSVTVTLAGLVGFNALPAPVLGVIDVAQSFRIPNDYGLFRVMTTQRMEIVLEGSDDGLDWKPYEFPYKPGDVMRRPAFVAPHQPRLDWQMWFAALATVRQNPWVLNLTQRLLEGSPQVLGLMAHDPFPGRPPRQVRALLYEYHFTGREHHARTGAWWWRTPMGIYLPPLSLRDGRLVRPEPVTP